ncbi:MAG: TonB-dependent receptor [Bacteroidia bacterium]|nr:TonB-dependent receptor [Bacteroidia bacterium]
MKTLFIFLLHLFFSSVFSQKISTVQPASHTFSGYVKDAKNGEIIIGATIFVKELKTGAASNVYGFYSISIPEGNYTVVYNSLGYLPVSKQIRLYNDTSSNVELVEEVKQLQEVTVSAENEDANVKNVEMSINKLDIKSIKKIPALLGEVDVIRSIQLLPGVTTVGEGASGFNVRGGTIDQNLVLLDEAPVFNSSHLFGFFSVFNPDAVKDVKLIKGGIPAQYGGRLSSILDVRMKDGNNKKFEVNGGVGIIFSRLSVEGPMAKGKGSFIVAGRRSYVDVLAKPFLNSDLKGSKFYFYDLTAKANYTFSDKNRLFLSGYLGRDVFGAANVFGFNWGNATGTLRWNHVFGEKVFLNTSLIYSNYDYSVEFGSNGGRDHFLWKSKIINYSVKPEFTYFLNTKNTIRFGAQSTYYNFVPGTARATSLGASTDFSLKDKFALESAVYISNEQKIGDLIILEYGLRISSYQYLGGDSVYTFNYAEPNTRKLVNTRTFAPQNTDVQNYNNFEPRFAAKIDITESSSIKLSYNRTTQYLHLISNTAASIPLDVWTPSTNNIKPQISDQEAIGYFKNFGKNNMYETSVETYYKYMQNQIDYIDGAQLRLNQYLEADLMTGIGRAYGAELYVRKTKGKFTGWISYTLARTERKVDGINQNNWYPNRFDKLHNLNVVSNYTLNARIEFSANFVFMTGTPTTFPTNRIDLVVAADPNNSATIIVPHNSQGSRNNYRIPPYHRLDLSVTLYQKKKEHRKWEWFVVASVYNVYNRLNPFSVYFQQNPDNVQQTQAVQYSIIGRVIPAVSFNFKF